MAPDTLPPASRSSLRRRLDQIGLGLAGLCAVHCLATLLVISALGVGGHFLFDENILAGVVLVSLGHFLNLRAAAR